MVIWLGGKDQYHVRTVGALTVYVGMIHVHSWGIILLSWQPICHCVCQLLISRELGEFHWQEHIFIAFHRSSPTCKHTHTPPITGLVTSINFTNLNMCVTDFKCGSLTTYPEAYQGWNIKITSILRKFCVCCIWNNDYVPLFTTHVGQSGMKKQTYIKDCVR